MAEPRAEDTMTTQQPLARYGPESWRTEGDVRWSNWDLWFCVLCVADHGGDWAGLDADITSRHAVLSCEDGTAKWSHLLDLRERLRSAGLSAAELVAEAAADRKVIAKARAKVLKGSLYGRDMTPAMINTPSRRLETRALFGAWPKFPHSPREPYERLAARFNVGHPRYEDGWATRDLAYEISGAESELLDAARGEARQSLAVRRAALTIYHQAAESCDDSYGTLGDVAGDALADYVHADWPASGVAPEVFWRDILELCCMLSNYGLLHQREIDLLSAAGATYWQPSL